MAELILTITEVRDIRQVIDEIEKEFQCVDEQALLDQITVYAQELPRRIRSHFNEFRLRESPSGICKLSGFPIDDTKIGNTPEHWAESGKRAQHVFEYEVFLLLLGSLLGDPFGWATQQAGRIVHDVAPTKGHEFKQINSNSSEAVSWHTEDAFHPYYGEYVGLLCLRNPYGVATTYACIDSIDISDTQKRLLRETKFRIRPDESHQSCNGVAMASEREVDLAYEKIRELNRHPTEVGVLYGDTEFPYIRIDPHFIDISGAESDAQRAYEQFVDAFNANLREVVLQPGDVLFVDNCKAVHGRRAFSAQYDGFDRWLKRINVTRDLRRSREARKYSNARVIY